MGGQDALESGMDLSAGARMLSMFIESEWGEVEGAVTNSNSQPASALPSY